MFRNVDEKVKDPNAILIISVKCNFVLVIDLLIIILKNARGNNEVKKLKGKGRKRKRKFDL